MGIDAEDDELLPMVHELEAVGDDDDDEPMGAGVLCFANDEDEDIYLIMPRIPCTRHTRRPKEMGG